MYVLLVGLVLFLTPPGQSVAQDVLRFFTLAERDQMPLPTSRPTDLPVPTRTAAPTRLDRDRLVTIAESMQ